MMSDMAFDLRYEYQEEPVRGIVEPVISKGQVVGSSPTRPTTHMIGSCLMSDSRNSLWRGIGAVTVH